MECPEYLVTSQVSDHDKRQGSSQAATSTVTLPSQNLTSLDNSDQSTENLQIEPEAMSSQMSDATTITLSSPSQIIGMDSSDEFGVCAKNCAEKECQTMDGVFLSTNDYEILLKKA